MFSPNFGDALSPLVVSLLSGRNVVYRNGGGKLVGLGSIFFALESGDCVWGAGFADARHISYALRARDVIYRAVRGPRTRDILRHNHIDCPEVLGDPAILLPLIVADDVPIQFEIGVVPHWSQYRVFAGAFRDPRVRVIDVCQERDEVARQILSCSVIVATSLHAIIFAEAYGRAALCLSLEAAAPLSLFKFQDYFESTDRDLFVRSISTPKDALRVSSTASQVQKPRFHRESLLEAFPFPLAGPIGRPCRRWGLGCEAL